MIDLLQAFNAFSPVTLNGQTWVVLYSLHKRDDDNDWYLAVPEGAPTPAPVQLICVPKEKS